MKRSLLIQAFLGLCMSLALIGCNSGGSSSVTNSGAGGTSGGGNTSTAGNSILNGKYAFTFSGTATQTGNPVLIAGSFTANGSGTISGGVEDLAIIAANGVAANGGLSKALSFTGTYTVGSDGRGTLNFTSISQSFDIVVDGTNHGQLIRFDSGASGSGTFDLQNTSAFNTSAFQGSYVFEWNGSDSSGGPVSGIGNVTFSNGSASGAGEGNDSGSYGQASAIFMMGTPDVNGHGTLNATYNGIATAYSYYIISASRMVIDETDYNVTANTGAGVVGEFDAQSSSVSVSSFSGNYALNLNGANTTGLLVMAGQIAASGGAINSSDVVENTSGTVARGGFTSGLYIAADTVDGIGVTGRFTLTATDPAGNPDNFSVYQVSPTQAFMMETDNFQLTAGPMLSQSGTFSSSSLSGNYGMNVTGIDLQYSFGADIVGQFTSAGNSTLSSGTMDINYQAALESGGSTTLPNNSISGGSYVMVNAAAGHGTLSFTADSTALKYDFYFVTANQIYLVETDNVFMAVGSGLSQPTIP